MVVDLYHLMGHALAEAELAFAAGEVPVGAVLAHGDGQIIASAHNQPVGTNDPTAHAEMQVLRKAGQVLKNYRLTGSVLVATIEPCAMCMGAAIHARVATLIYGAPDTKTGAAGSLYNLGEDHRLNHRIQILSGIREEECRTVMQKFFRARR
jgi:tRNA(adenine34) deaminase